MDFTDRIRRDLAELARADRHHRVFGAATHRYQLGATVTARRVAAVERRDRFQFPADYRRFVIELGAGGAGPGYGVFPFGMIDRGFDHAPWRTWNLEPGQPFPHRAAWNDVTLLERGRPHPDDFEEWDDYQAALDQWHDTDQARAAEQAYWQATGTTRGCIPLCHHGCALRDWLVVTGAEAGHVWHDASSDELGIAPVATPTRPRTTFTDWYLDWLDAALAEASRAGR